MYSLWVACHCKILVHNNVNNSNNVRVNNTGTQRV